MALLAICIQVYRRSWWAMLVCCDDPRRWVLYASDVVFIQTFYDLDWTLDTSCLFDILVDCLHRSGLSGDRSIRASFLLDPVTPESYIFFSDDFI